MKLRFSNQRSRALTRTDVLMVIVVVAVVAAWFLTALRVTDPHLHRSPEMYCVSNLKQIGIAFRIWEGDNGDKYPMAVSVTNGGAMELVATGNVAACFQVMSNELSTPKILRCPGDTHRAYAANFSTGFSGANISYFLNPDAVETYPQMILDGDDNLLVDGKPVQPGILNLQPNQTITWTKDRHHGEGNIGMADGHVEQPAGKGLNSAVVSSTSGVPTNNAANRWLIP
jgi:prepilin-type processing-associated H-X9-DG protein